jgi:hypothetical protein
MSSEDLTAGIFFLDRLDDPINTNQLQKIIFVVSFRNFGWQHQYERNLVQSGEL